MAMEMTGSGKTIDSRMIGLSWPHSVSPVLVLLKPDGGRQLAGVDDLAVLAMVGVHLQDAADAFLLALGRVVDVRAGLQPARIDAEVGELADVGVGHDLESQGGERRVV